MWLFTTKLGRRILVIASTLVVVGLLIGVGSAKSKRILLAYKMLSGKPVSSTEQFGKMVQTVVEERDPTGSISYKIASGMLDSKVNEFKEEADELIDSEENTGSGDTDEGTDTYPSITGDVIIDGWLVLHSSPSVSGSLHTDHLGSGIYTGNKWSMGETKGGGNKYMRGLYPDPSLNTPLINGRPSSYKNTNSEGRYWVAIGPAWFNPNYIGSDGYPPSKTCSASDWFAGGTGQNFDIEVVYEGSTYYIYACCGDAKAHTFGDGKGLCQSAYGYDGSYAGSNYRDGSVVEWVNVPSRMGANLDNTLQFNGLYF